ncbi:hypothetical protein HDU67_000981, partial [Dinochytrium kinnereticum]
MSLVEGGENLAERLSDDIWIMVACWVAAWDFRDLVEMEGVDWRFRRIARTNLCYFTAYRSVYPTLTRAITYRGGDPEPPDWRAKLIASYLADHAWTSFARSLSGPHHSHLGPAVAALKGLALEEQEDDDDDDYDYYEEPAPSSMVFPQRYLSLRIDPPTVVAPQPVSYFGPPMSPTRPHLPSPHPSQTTGCSMVLGEREISCFLLTLHSNPDARFAYASMVHEPSVTSVLPDEAVPVTGQGMGPTVPTQDETTSSSTTPGGAKLSRSNAKVMKGSLNRPRRQPHLDEPTVTFQTPSREGIFAPGSVLGVSVLHRVGPTPTHPLDLENDPGSDLRTSVFLIHLPTLRLISATSFKTAGPRRSWNWLVLRHLDVSRNLMVMAEEDDRNERWHRLVFRRCLEGAAFLDAEIAGRVFATPAGGREGDPEGVFGSRHFRDRVAEETDRGHLAELLMPEDLVGYSMAGFPENLGQLPAGVVVAGEGAGEVDGGEWDSVSLSSNAEGDGMDEGMRTRPTSVTSSNSSTSTPPPAPLSIKTRPKPTPHLTPHSTLLIMCVTKTPQEQGVILTVDTQTGTILARSQYGTQVTTIDVGMPYDAVVVTGHADHRVRVWDFLSGVHLMSFQCPLSSMPVLGISWVDEPECWGGGVGSVAGMGGWRRPRGLKLVSFADLEEEEEEEEEEDDEGEEGDDDDAVHPMGGGGAGHHPPALHGAPHHPNPEAGPAPAPTPTTRPGFGEFVLWDLEKFVQTARHNLRLRKRVTPASSPSTTSPTTQTTRIIPPLRTSSMNVPVLSRVKLSGAFAGDEVATFTVVHPYLLVLTTGGTFVAVHLESGERVVRIEGVGERALVAAAAAAASSSASSSSMMMMARRSLSGVSDVEDVGNLEGTGVGRRWTVSTASSFGTGSVVSSVSSGTASTVSGMSGGGSG